MNTDFLKLTLIEEKINNNKKMSLLMRGIAALLTFTVAFCCLSRPDTTKLAWKMLIPIHWIIFLLDIYYLKRNKKEEYNVYFLLKEQYQQTREIAKAKGDDVSMEMLRNEENQEVPNPRVEIPLVYYLVLTIVDAIALIFLL